MKEIIEFIKDISAHELDNNPRIRKLTGDASERAFYRISGSGENSLVLMINPVSFDSNSFPYLVQHSLFKSLGLPLADIVHVNDKKGWILMEDLGDITMQKQLQSCTLEEKKLLYENATSLLFTFHSISESKVIKHRQAFTLGFDTRKLYDELLFFYDNFIRRMMGMQVAPSLEPTIRQGFYTIACYLAGRPKILCHRDYHSRNIMIKQSRLYLIDFQDARMGPRSYDIISLLRDSYVDIDNSMRSELIEFFFKNTNLIHDQEMDKELLYMTLQRNIKALGTFAFQFCQKGKRTYLEFIPRTIRYIIDGLSELRYMKDFSAGLKNILDAYDQKQFTHRG